ncbi:helix-turn-helix domain-containing protein [Acidovorax sp. SUPP1855]|uniref:AraC-like ligand-binding domain-containing protein n=1 Tax=Acidovorax sp. SUPP1855 TaxID=431774 RepID=UPI0023DE6484|nr:helix-turn-helix domain-containing protein [Acidovorax sp. SUPP1855]GKS84001.1 helix-turn-helix domain-containing protein [Acidovorax sp. SUPP1855]
MASKSIAMQSEPTGDRQAMECAIRRWTTDAVPAAQRADYWVGAVCDCFLDMEVEPSQRQAFSATLASMPCGGLRVNRVSGSAQRVRRTLQGIRRSGGDNFYYLLCKESSPCHVAQDDAGAARLLPGDLALIDSRRRYLLEFPEAVDTVSIQIPIGWLDTWLPVADRWLGRRLDGAAEWGRVLSAYVTQLRAEQPARLGTLQAEHLGGLLSLACGAAPEAPPRPGLLQRIEHCVRQRFGEHGLTAADVADDVGVSLRTLHRALSAGGSTFALLLMRERMAVAQRMLHAPSHRHLTVAEIGRRAGFLDTSHFARACRQWCGRTPAQERCAPTQAFVSPH